MNEPGYIPLPAEGARTPLPYFAFSLLLFILSSGAASAQNGLPEVLILLAFRTTNPANTGWQIGIAQGLNSESDRPIQIDVEAPD